MISSTAILALGRSVVVIASGGSMVKLSICSTVCEGTELSRNVNVCVVVAAVVGVPEIAPVAESNLAASFLL
jgi:hypothetical protein